MLNYRPLQGRLGDGDSLRRVSQRVSGSDICPSASASTDVKGKTRKKRIQIGCAIKCVSLVDVDKQAGGIGRIQATVALLVRILSRCERRDVMRRQFDCFKEFGKFDLKGPDICGTRSSRVEIELKSQYVLERIQHGAGTLTNPPINTISLGRSLSLST